MIFKIFIVILYSYSFINAQSLDDLEWLKGRWVYYTQEDSSYEVWDRNNDGSYDGFGLTIINGDTVFYEELRILEKEGSIYYKAVIENQNEGMPVLFKLTKQKPGFNFVNRQHDFPQKIGYNPEGDTLKIKLEGIEEYYEKVIDLIFIKEDF